jgi:hypothetical protein
VTLVDTDGAGVDRADERGLWVGERHIGLDVVVLASGFEVGTEYARRCGYETTGRDGITLSQRWSDGMVSLHGMHVAGFPNLFILGMSQGANLISNITHNLSEAATTAATIIAAALSTGASTVEVTPEAEAAWIERLESSGRAFLGNPDCTPGYYNNEGGAIGRRERLGASGYPDGPVAFFHYIDAWRRSGEFAGLHFAASAPTDTSGAPAMTTALILDSMQRRMAAMHSLYYQAVDTMDLDHVNHVERHGVLPIAFSLFHYTNMGDASFMMITGVAPEVERRVAGRRAGGDQRSRQAPHGRRNDGPAHRRLRRLQGVPARRVRPNGTLARHPRPRRVPPRRRPPAVPLR